MLTFNLSCTDKRIVNEIKQPFQCMPSTISRLSQRIIESYLPGDNKGIMVHLNYITRIFTDKSIESTSTARSSLRLYRSLCKRLGTDKLLIHMPSTLSELAFVNNGIEVIRSELTEHGIDVFLEIPVWAKDLREFVMKESKLDNPADRNIWFIELIRDVIGDTFKFNFVPDTAHLYGNGCTGKDMINILKAEADCISYIHLNGNLESMYHSDKHVAMFSLNNKIPDAIGVAKCCASLNAICIAENSSPQAPYERWSTFAKECGFVIVDNSEQYSL